MQAIAVRPGASQSAQLVEVSEPPGAEGGLLAAAVALGICGTDREIVAGAYGQAPPGRGRLVLGHESLGRVVEAPPDSRFAAGDLVVGVVRRPDPKPCRACAAGEWDMCENGLYAERGIKGLDGYGAERWRLDERFAVRVDPRLGLNGVLIEPASVVAKAWAHIERIGSRSRSWAPRRVLVTGGGPVGLLAAMMGRQRGLEVTLLDRVVDGPKPRLARAMGARWLTDLKALGSRPDLVLETTGAAEVIARVTTGTARGGIVCLIGLSRPRTLPFDLGAFDQAMVLENDVIFGSVNANLEHYRAAHDALRQADPDWLSAMITRRVPLARWAEAFEVRPDDIKVVLDFEARG
ncbi:MAG: glucose 1-dehydrogenase [Caulobacteraceae bacterium]|nr:glucose 1-dehydrogenase [Caulobacteraceae bacterium]